MQERFCMNILNAINLKTNSQIRHKINAKDTQERSQKSTIWSASMRTVLSENFLSQKLNRSSRLGPNKSMTRMQYSCSIPNHLTFGMPAERIKITLAWTKEMRPEFGSLITSSLKNFIQFWFIMKLGMLSFGTFLEIKQIYQTRISQRRRTNSKFQRNNNELTSLTATSSFVWTLVPERQRIKRGKQELIPQIRRTRVLNYKPR